MTVPLCLAAAWALASTALALYFYLRLRALRRTRRSRWRENRLGDIALDCADVMSKCERCRVAVPVMDLRFEAVLLDAPKEGEGNGG